MDNSKNIFITGASGLVGGKLVPALIAKGHRVTTIGRSPSRDGHLSWHDPELESGRSLTEADIVIHLAGSNIGGARWTGKNKADFLSSRVQSAKTIHNALANHGVKLDAFISASAIGYYGSETSDSIHTEESSRGHDFVAGLCEKWEAAADEFGSVSERVVKLRIGVALSPEGGALKKLLTPTRLGLGSPLGSGKQWMPWIHLDDLVDILVYAIHNTELHGVYNAVAPEHATNRQVHQALAKSMNKTFWAPAVPAFLLKLMFGEMSEIFLGGSRVSSEKFEATGFAFKHPTLQGAMDHLIGK